MIFSLLISSIITLTPPAVITLEHAKTFEEIEWGLMGRDGLPENSGMLFSFPYADFRNFWMFNCNFDISLAYIDQNQILREIYLMRAYPEMMDAKRPILKNSDIAQYPKNDPIKEFFHNKGQPSKIRAKYALEVNSGWFRKNNIEPNDFIVWDGSSGLIYKSLLLSELAGPIISFANPQPVAIINDTSKSSTLTFQDSDGRTIKQETLEPSKSSQNYLRKISLCKRAAFSVTIE